MTIAETLSLAIQNLRAEKPDTVVTPIVPTLSQLIESYEYPANSVLMGVAEDGFPILLNLRTTRPGSILLLGDAGSGKTNFLRFIAQSVVWMYEPNELSFAVITPGVEGWQGWESLPHSLGVFSSFDANLKTFLFDICEWAEKNETEQQRIILIDNLDALAHLDSDGLDSLHWLLYNGPLHGVWMFVTLNATSALEMPGWLNLFRVRIYGHIADREVSDALTQLPAAGMGQLMSGAQFSMRSKGQWLRFWLPEAE
jgi:hypothetical protein